jgi:alkaline phosphatase
MIARFGCYVFLKASLYSRLTNAYRRNHFWVTLVGQTIPVVRRGIARPMGQAIALEGKFDSESVS